jgi:hypothetical protein
VALASWGFLVPFRIIAAAALLAALPASLASPAQAQFETRASLFLADESPYSVVVGDFNRDGVLDLAEINELPTGSVEILLGNGDGTFRLGATYPVAVFPWYGATASLRHNGILDLVVSDKLSDDVWVMLGNGDGTFQPAVGYPTSAGSYMVSLGDFTGDGKIDIITLEGTNTQGGLCYCVEVLAGNGDGTFGAPITTPLPYGMGGYAMANGDFNDDGKSDVAVVGEAFPSYEAAILLGNGDGTFSADGSYLLAASPGSIAAGYFTSDKTKVDLAISNGGALSVLLGNGDGTFQQPASYDANFASWVIAQDLDGDGKTDLAASDFGELLSVEFPPGVNVLKGNGDGTFQASVFYPAGTKTEANYVASGDFNNDGLADLALVGSRGSFLISLLNTGSATFSPTSPLTFSGQLIGSTSAPMTTTITNSGTTELKFSSVECSGAPFHMEETTCRGSLAPGAQCTITANFTAQAKGIVSGTITIRDSVSSKPQFVELVGTGTTLGISPSELLFPPQKVGTQSAPRSIHLTNVGNTSLGFTHPIGVFGGNGFADFPESDNCGSHLRPKASCTVTITFAPQRKGRRSSSLDIEDDSGDSPQKMPLSGTAD